MHPLFRVCFIAFFSLLLPALRVSGSLVDPSFRLDPGVNGEVETVRVQLDGRLLVGGRLTLTNGALAIVVQLLPDGKLDSSFSPLLFNWNLFPYRDQPVEILSLSDGQVLVAFATFSSGSSPPIFSRVFRLAADGTGRTVWAEFPAAVRLTQLADGKVMVWGEQPWTYSTGWNSRGFIERRLASGELDPEFQISGVALQAGVPHLPPYQRIDSFAECANGDLVLGGSFGWPEPRPEWALPVFVRLRSNGSLLWLYSRPDRSGSVSQTFETGSGRVLYSSSFDGLVRFFADGRVDNATWRPPGLEPVSSLLLRDGRLLVVGRFTQIDGLVRSNLVCLLDDGRVDLRFDPGSSFGDFLPVARVDGITQQADGRILLAGGFTSFDGTEARGLVRLFSQNPEVPAWTNSIQYRFEQGAAECGGPLKLLLIRSGDTNGFHQVRIQTKPGTAESGTDYVPVDSVITFRPGEQFQTISVPIIYDLLAEGTETFWIKLESLSTDAPVIGPNPLEVAIFERDCRASFGTNALSVIEGAPAKFPSTGLIPVSNRSTVPIRIRSRDLTARAGLDYKPIDQVISQSESIPVWTIDNAHADGDREFELEFVEVPEGIQVGPTERIRVTIHDNDLSIGPARGISGAISTVQALTQRRWFLAGDFTHVDGLPRPGMARFHSDGSLDLSFAPPPALTGHSVLSAAFPDGHVLVAGKLPPELDLQGVQMIRLKPDGSLDATFRLATDWSTGVCRPAPNGFAQLHVWPDGGFVATGNLPRLSRCGVTAQVVRFSASGTLLGQWTLGSDVASLQAAPDSSIVVNLRTSLIRLSGDGEATTLFGPEHPGWKGYVNQFLVFGNVIWSEAGPGRITRLIPPTQLYSEKTQFNFGTKVINLGALYRMKLVRTNAMLICGNFATTGDDRLSGDLLMLVNSAGDVLKVGKLELQSGFVYLLDSSMNELGEVALVGWVDSPWIDPRTISSSWLRFSPNLIPVADLRISEVRAGPHGFELGLRGQAPQGYQVEQSADLESWTLRFSSPAFNWGQLHLDDEPLAEEEVRFYRIRF